MDIQGYHIPLEVISYPILSCQPNVAKVFYTKFEFLKQLRTWIFKYNECS